MEEIFQASESNLLRLARRWNNQKRTYLLVNPLQGKHIPVSPHAAFQMMERLGDKISKRFSRVRLVVGFAETATAVGAVVASRFGADCCYLHTTRESLDDGCEWVSFLEEHSHAVEQKLCGTMLPEWFAESPQILFVDDELSTGKTLRNMIAQLRERYPQLAGKELIAGSILSRLSGENSEKLAKVGVHSECLLHLSESDYSERVSHFEARPAVRMNHVEIPPADVEFQDLSVDFPNFRKGVLMQNALHQCEKIADKILNMLYQRLSNVENVLVLGTEECMFPGLILARKLERSGLAETVRFHATTRSPIGISNAENYPITNGYCMPSVYDAARETYLYNMAQYDLTVVLSDAPEPSAAAIADLAKLVRLYGCPSLIYLRGAVQY